MGLRVVKVFSDLTEAHVACGALRASGIDATVFDVHFGAIDWSRQLAIGGFRLLAPEPELAEAVSFLQRPRRRIRPTPPDKGVVWRTLAFGLGLFLGPYYGWMVVVVRGRSRAIGFADLTAMAIAFVYAAAPIGAVMWILNRLEAGAFNPP